MKSVLEFLKNKRYLTPLLIGVFIRLILMPITIHPDFWGQSIATYFFAYKGTLNFYDLLFNLGPTDPIRLHFSVDNLYIYPPLTYFVQGVLRLIVRPLSDPSFIPSFINNPSFISSFKGYFYQIFIIKLPYIFIDLLAGFLLTELFSDLKKKKVVFWLWMLNPITIYVTFMVFQNDILPTIFVILSLVLYYRKKPLLSILSLGIGASFKLFPLLFLPPLVFLLSSDLKQRVKHLVLGIIPYLFTTLPFMLTKGYRHIVLFNEESQKVLFMKINVSGAEVIFPFILLLILIYLHAFYAEKKLQIESYMIFIMLLLFSVTQYHPQWFLWITPLFIIELVKANRRNLILVLSLTVCWFLITLSFEPSLSVGLFSPILPALKNSKGFAGLFGPEIFLDRFKSIIRSIFDGFAVYYVFRIYNFDIDLTKNNKNT